MNLDTTTATGRMMMNVIGSVAQFERELMLERQRIGIQKAKEDGKYKGVIGVGGLVLARIPVEIALCREAYYQEQTKERDEAVNNDVLKDQHPSMPINADKQTRVTFGGSKK